MGIYGQDWASYQSPAPDATGLSFAFIKVSQGLTYTNPEWTAQRDHARAAGLVVGYYHYPNMGNSAQQEADRFLGLAQPQAGELICLDWEGYDAANEAVAHSAQLAYKEAWLRYVKGRLPHNPVGLYANTDYWRNIDTTGYFQDFLWIATTGLPAGQPGISANWLFHQYSEAGGLDRDYCHLGSTADLRSWALAFQPAPPAPSPAPVPQPTPSPAPAPRGDEVASLQIPFGFAFDATGNLTDKTKLLVTPVPQLGGPRINYRNVDVYLGCDMGDVQVRIAIHNPATGWAADRIWHTTLKAADTRYPIWLQPGDDKISIGRVPESATDADSASVPASLLIEPVLA